MKAEDLIEGKSYTMIYMKNNTFIYVGKTEERFSFRLVNNSGDAVVPIDGLASFSEKDLELFEEKYIL